MEGKKISFGFMKTKKVEKFASEEKKDFIECLEERSIKVVGGEEKQEKPPLIIPMKPNTLVTAEKLKKIAEEVENAVHNIEPVDEPNETNNDISIPENETLDQMVVRELLTEAKNDKKIELPKLTVPINSQPILGGQKESTLDDYESVPIEEFGAAMLRGMGWTPGKQQNKYKEPQLRPKGLGLGADKVVKQNQKKPSGKDGEELMIVKNAFVHITSGKYLGCYGKVVSLDDDNGRVMVDIPVRKETVSLNEFMMQPVTKSEFDKQSRVINADKYEEYKKMEHSSQKKSGQGGSKTCQSTSKSNQTDYTQKNQGEIITESSPKISANGNSRENSRRRNSSSSEDRRKLSKKRYSSSDSLSSLSESEKRRKHKDVKNKYSSSDTNSSDSGRKKKKSKSHKRNDSPKRKRDIDKKRKGKKKRRDRDRSPNHKKHRK